MGVVLSALNRKTDAVLEYRRAVELAPSDCDALNNLGLLLAEAGDVASAQQYFVRASKAKPDFAAPHFNLGRVYLAAGHLAEARRALETAARLDPAYAPHVAELLRDKARDRAQNQ